MLEQGRATLLQGHEVAGFVVGHTVEPAAVKDVALHSVSCSSKRNPRLGELEPVVPY